MNNSSIAFRKRKAEDAIPVEDGSN